MNPPSSSHTQPDRRWKPLVGPLAADILPNDSPAHRPPLILLHGFTQTRRSWDPLVALLEGRDSFDRPVIRVDLPGHGGSGDIRADLPETADLVVETCGTGIYCGYSMGGRVALHIALQHPRVVDRLIAIGATPGIPDAEERRHRRIADDELADTIESIGVDAFLEQWLSQPMFAGLPHSETDLVERRRNSPSGLASSLRTAGTGTQDPLWSRLPELAMPVLLLAGSRDIKFAEIADRMVEAIGAHARSHRVNDAGHSAHLENPSQVADAIVEFCS